MSRHMINTFKNADVEKINKYLCDLHDRELVFSRSAAEIEDIKLAVEDMVERIISKFGEYGDRRMYEVSQKYLVGSMAEGTRIEEPSEFDFLVVLKDLSVPGALGMVFIDNAKDCPKYHSMSGHTFKHVHLKIKDSNLLKTFEEDFILDDGCLDKVFLKYINAIDVVNTSIRNIAGNAICKHTGTLSFFLNETGHNGPADTLKMEWTPKSTLKTQKLRISIDIVFAIEISHHVAKKEDTNVSQYFDQLQDDNSCFLLPSTGPFHDRSCFKFTFTQTEVKLLKSLSVHHIACYRLMKCIVLRGGDKVSRAFPSYLIKTVLLRHSVHCPDKNNFLVCIVDNITKMSITCRHGNLAHMAEKMLFLKANFVTYEFYDEKEYQHMFGCLTEIVKQLVSNARIY